MSALEDVLKKFMEREGFRHKGPLCVALVMTAHGQKNGLPLDPEKLLTERGGQVYGLGKGPVQTILKSHGISRVLAEEGGRTSRGSVDNMRKYVALLNDLHKKGLADFKKIEAFWVGQVRAYFSAKPFKLRLDPSKSIRMVVRDLVEQAEKRQGEARGTTFVGTLLQHLVGAKLELLHPKTVDHHGANVADLVSGRPADFMIGDAAIHVTNVPGEALIRKCLRNIEAGLRPIIVTTKQGLEVADGLAKQVSIAGRIDLFDYEQFLAHNVYEIGKFDAQGRRAAIEQLIARYNQIVMEHETDPSLNIEIEK